MNEESFLAQIRTSPDDMSTLREYAHWLTANDDPRGEYLTAELELRATEAELLRLQTHIFGLTATRGVDSEWIDSLLPLIVRSPVAGAFHDRPAPDKPPFVKRGDLCHPETIVGIVEAMGVYNQIPAGHAGVVAEVLVSDGRPVETDEPLVRLTRAPRLMGGG